VKVKIVKCLEDNYAYIFTDQESKRCGVIDTPAFGPINNFLQENNLILTDILNTHHHGDHVGANLELKEKYSCTVWGSGEDAQRIPGIDKKLSANETFTIGHFEFHVMQAPGHTSHHLLYYLPKEKVLFSGDTLFSMGCGRLFEGTYEQMFHTLQQICKLPDDTLIYCGHEYSEKNGKFALEMEPQNQDIQARYKEVLRLRAQNLPTVPTTLLEEKKINPFLRTKSIEEFKKLRNMRNTF
jgi:hydroxyacylglutathione hydrolase